MSDPLSIAVNGINSAVARTTQSVTNVVNASYTGKNSSGDLVSARADQTNIAANAAVIKTVHKMDQALLDIKV